MVGNVDTIFFFAETDLNYKYCTLVNNRKSKLTVIRFNCFRNKLQFCNHLFYCINNERICSVWVQFRLSNSFTFDLIYAPGIKASR